MHLKLLFILLLCAPLGKTEPVKSYVKEYNQDGSLAAEGWMMDTMKVAYWKQYHPNGALAAEGHYQNNKQTGYWYFYTKDNTLIKEGHYSNGIAENWWIFYDLALDETRKIQFKNNQRNGFCLVYKGNTLQKVEKYTADVYQGEWTSVRSFKKDNPDVSLY